MNPKRILVVDDETLNLKIIRATLEGSEYQLDLAEHGGVGWDRLQDPAVRYDLVVLDRMMPVMDGLTLLKRMKAEARYRTIPVVMQTAAAAPEQVAEGLAAGAYYYLTKPYEPEALLAIVRSALDMAEQSDTLDRARRTCELTTSLLQHARYRFQRLEQASAIAAQLALLCPTPGLAAMGLTELLVNAVEHGNLELSYAEKSRLKWEDGWEQEIARRLELPDFSQRHATVEVESSAAEVVFTIRDEGPGFDWQTYLDFAPERAYDPNGRGIAMARQMSFTSLAYQGRGNVVVARIVRA